MPALGREMSVLLCSSHIPLQLHINIELFTTSTEKKYVLLLMCAGWGATLDCR